MVEKGRKIDVIVKINDLGGSKIEFLNSTLKLSGNNLIITTLTDDGKMSKVFNLSEISAYKQYYNKIIKKQK